MESQSVLNPIFFALIPTVLFIALTVVFIRWRRIAGSVLQRRAQQDRQQRLVDKSR